jgi:transposase
VQTIVFDITSLSSYSNLLNEVEWGYNRDHDHLPQVNLGIVYAEHEQLPLYYQVYPGSIRDVSTLPNMVRYLEALALSPTLFVMDRGFYSTANLAALMDHSFTFLLPLPRTVTLFADLLAQHYQTLTALPNSFLFQGEIVCHVQTTVPLHMTPVYAHLYFDPAKHYAQAQRFLTPLWKAEAEIQGKTFHHPTEARQALTDQVKGATPFFRITHTADQVDISRDALALTRHLAPMGTTILLTNQADLDRVQVLQLYRQKDFLEKTFDTLKHEFDGQRVRGHSTEAMMGRLFLKFVSLIIYSAFTKTMRTQHLFTHYSARELLYELKKIRLVEMKDGTHVLTEISKRQRGIFKTFDIEMPIIKT